MLLSNLGPHEPAQTETIFETELWRRSLPACLGVICLCEEWRARLALRYPDIPTLVVRHPTVLEGGVVDDVRAADCAAYQARPQVVQVGDWLRQLQAIFFVAGAGASQAHVVQALYPNLFGTRNGCPR